MAIRDKESTGCTDCRSDLRALAEAATPGPWIYFPKPKYGEFHVSVPIDGSTMRAALFDEGCHTSRPQADARFIAAANPTAILALLDRLEALEGKVAAGVVAESPSVSTCSCRICKGTGKNQSGIGACEWCEAVSEPKSIASHHQERAKA